MTEQKESWSGEKRPPLTIEDMVQASLGLIVVPVDDELVAIDLLNDRYFRFNSTATAVWREIEAGTLMREIAAKLAETYRLESTIAEHAVLEITNNLRSAGLVVKCE